MVHNLPTWLYQQVAMSISLKSPIEQIEELLKTSPRSTDIVFSCTSGGRGLHIQAWDLSNRAVLRTYRSDTDGEGSCLCMAGQDYLLCGLKNKPLIYVWKIEKVSNYKCGRSFMEILYERRTASKFQNFIFEH